MFDTQSVGRLLVIAGAALIVLGLLLLVIGRIPLLGRLPGDFTIRRGSTMIYLPLATSILASLLLTVLLRFVLRR
jgi:hypothetical protein